VPVSTVPSASAVSVTTVPVLSVTEIAPPARTVSERLAMIGITAPVE
jgi:hypothetical protein